jgi:NAD(P)-dependent dehydrogenase (short-subunit alcohol dehydrogenase family)
VKLAGTRVWITGASSGIGEALVRRLVRTGARVAITARRGDELERIAAAHRAPEHTLAVAADVTDPEQVSNAARRIETEWGGIDLAILNAGTYHVVTDQAFKAADFIHTFQVNLFGAMSATEAVLPGMLHRGHGRIAVTASLTGLIPLPSAAAYGASKAALTYAFEAMRYELEPRGVGVTIIQPGFVRTPMTRPNRFWMPAMLEPGAAADIIVRGLACDHDEIIFPRRLAWPVQAASRLPHPLYRRMVRLAVRLGAH